VAVAPFTGASLTTYFECMSWPSAVIGLTWTPVPVKCSVTHSPVPIGAGSACSTANSSAVAEVGLPAS